MRLGVTFTALTVGLASLLGARAASSADSGSSSSNSSAPGVTSPEVAFLQTLQTAQISSMSCLITLVNMTQQNIGKCLNIPALAPLVVDPSTNSSFSTQLATYLGAACSQTCREADIVEAQSQLTATCSSQSGTVSSLCSEPSCRATPRATEHWLARYTCESGRPGTVI